MLFYVNLEKIFKTVFQQNSSRGSIFQLSASNVIGIYFLQAFFSIFDEIKMVV